MGFQLRPLDEDDVQVWLLRADADAVKVSLAFLSEDELARMERMRVGVARDEFAVGRAMLRVLVGSVAGCSARDLRFSVGQHGKPGVEGVEFSVAHSHGLIAIALCRRVAVGVDVERIDQGIEALDIARSSFSAGEIARIEGAGEGEERARVFYRVWVRKEAIVKAHGQGLTIPLDSFDVGGEQAVMLGDERYFVREIEVGDGFAGALALREEGLTVGFYEIDRWDLLETMRAAKL